MVVCNSTRSKQPLANDFTPSSSPEARLSILIRLHLPEADFWPHTPVILTVGVCCAARESWGQPLNSNLTLQNTFPIAVSTDGFAVWLLRVTELGLGQLRQFCKLLIAL